MKRIIQCAILKLFCVLSIVSSTANIDTKTIQLMTESWYDHNENVTLVYLDDHVAIYYDDEVNKNGNITWPFEIISNAWKYVKETYGPLGPDPLLYVILHATKYKKGCRTKWYRESEPGSRNQMDCGEGKIIEETPRGSRNLPNVLYFMGKKVAYGEALTPERMDKMIGGRGMPAIVWYDLTVFLNDPAESIVTEIAKPMRDSHKGVFWFRNWFLPIYELFGGTFVLKQFVNISNHHLQKKISNSAYRDLNLGEFVHFWSGAANADLLPSAIKLLNNSREFYDELVEARKTFPLINYTRANCDAGEGVIRCDNSATCTHILLRCDGEIDCIDGADEANCAVCRKGVYKCARGGCVTRNKVCDYKIDCPLDDSDESICKITSEEKVIRDTSNGHDEVLTLVYLDDHVAIYYDEEVKNIGNITWPFEIISNAWKYVKMTFGPFGPDPLLYVFLHATKYKGSCYTMWHRESEPGSQNIIDCVDGKIIGTTPRGSNILHNLLYLFGEVVLGGMYISLMQIDQMVGGRGMLDILWYDLTLFLKDPTEYLVPWKAMRLKSLQNDFFWVRDWHLPIYESFGGASILRRFVNITNRHWQEAGAMADYRNLSLGEFVHFWSGAANQDLLPSAISLLNNSLEFYAELVEARKSIPYINYTRANCDVGQGVIRCDESFTCKNIAWRCDGEKDCSDGSDEANCTTCRSSAFECARGGCVTKEKVCDYTRDCLLDDSDEYNCTDVFYPQSAIRSWKSPFKELKRVHLDEDVVVYCESGMNTSLLWVSEIYSQTWAHVKETYGTIAKNPRLGVVLRLDDKDQENCTRIDVYKFSDTIFAQQIVIDCGRRGLALDNTSNYLHFVSTIAKIIRENAIGTDNNGDIDADVSGNLMELIISYDLFVTLNRTSATEVSIWKKVEQNKTWKGVYFFRDWFLPIYVNNEGSNALGNFYRLAKSHWGKDLKKTPRKYLNLGEFVHFWSGAAGEDLLPIALQVFIDSSTFYPQLVEAKKNFPSINYTATLCRDEQFRCEEDLVCIQEKWRCNGVRECGDESDEANCTGDSNNTKISLFETSHVVPIVVGILVFVLLVTSVGLGIKLVLYRTRVLKFKQIRSLTNAEIKEFLDGNLSLNTKNANISVYCRPFISDYEVPRENLVIDEASVLGSGEFGIVKKGKLLMDQHSSRSTDVTVAVKMVKPNAKVEHFKAFLKEIKIMAFLGRHQNIVSLLGTVTNNIQNCEVFVALEFCSNGDLLHFLRENCGHFQDLFCLRKEMVTSVVFAKGKNCDLNSDVTFVTSSVPKIVADASLSTNDSAISTFDLLEWARQIADGMNYLTFKKVIHGDLAARNVLLTENNTAKIGDFGLSHQLINYEVYRKTSESPLPWRWLAIESLSSRTFSVHSDVWAFGVTLWEIFSFGKVPYPERRWDRRYINDLANGMRPNLPEFGNNEIYNLMMGCMKMVPAERIPFSEISLELQRIKLSLIPEHDLASTSKTRSSCIYSVLQETEE